MKKKLEIGIQEVQIEDIKMVSESRKRFLLLHTHPSGTENLKSSLKEKGIVNPPMINMRYQLIDGFARINAWKELGHETIMVQVVV
jgi:ParB-like chromosome segregation protein Spo0J